MPVTITADQYSGYFDEPNDVIPAPPTGCDGVDPAAAAKLDVTVCHLNANGTYSLLRYPPGDLGGNEGNKGDLIPAPGGTCPGLAANATPVPTPSPTATPEATTDPDDGDVIAEATASPKPEPKRKRAPAATPAPVQPIESGTATAQSTAEELPFTGLDLGLIAGLGLAFVLMGAGLRLVAVPQPPFGVTR